MPKRERYSFEYLILRVIEYLIRNENRGPFSKYHLMTKIKGIHEQRQDRITDLLDILIKRGWIDTFPIPTEDRRLYKIADEGKEWYNNVGKKFAEFLRDIYER